MARARGSIADSAMSHALWTEQAARGGNGSAGAVETCIRLLRPSLSTQRYVKKVNMVMCQ